ncbi:MAG TPA: 2TM domain-containing protein [Flavobacterium sp.]|jgi:hypothetical protein
MEKQDIIEQQRLERATKRVKSIAGFYRHLMIYIIINLFLIGAKYFTLDPGEEFWEFSTFTTALFWGFGVAFHALGVFTNSVMFGRDWEERKIRQYMEKNKSERWE